MRNISNENSPLSSLFLPPPHATAEMLIKVNTKRHSQDESSGGGAEEKGEGGEGRLAVGKLWHLCCAHPPKATAAASVISRIDGAAI